MQKRCCGACTKQTLCACAAAATRNQHEHWLLSSIWHLLQASTCWLLQHNPVASLALSIQILTVPDASHVLNSVRHALQDPEDDRGIMEGLRAAAAAVQAADFSAAHERLLDQPGSTAAELLQELKQAAKVCSPAAQNRSHSIFVQLYGPVSISLCGQGDSRHMRP